MALKIGAESFRDGPFLLKRTLLDFVQTREMRKIMSITINLEPQKEEVLRERAARRGRDADGYALELLDRLLEEPEQPVMGADAIPQQTLAEALAGHIGTQHSGRGELSQNTGKAFTQLMAEKRKAGRL